MQLWTLKEAYVKALGRGISASPGLKGFSIDISGKSGLSQATITCSSCDTTGHQWHFRLLDLSDKHVAALCIQTQQESEHIDLKMWQVVPGMTESPLACQAQACSQRPQPQL